MALFFLFLSLLPAVPAFGEGSFCSRSVPAASSPLAPAKGDVDARGALTFSGSFLVLVMVRNGADGGRTLRAAPLSALGLLVLKTFFTFLHFFAAWLLQCIL